jgi:ParB family chromosome partitioning protein
MVKLLGIQEIKISDIDVSKRMRPVSETAVVSLMASLMGIGQQSEIHVRRVRHQNNRLVLMAGAHRIEAHIRLGCTSISAKVWECTDDWAQMAEIDDNLAHAELNPLDLSVFLARRKTVYERMYPEAKRGAIGNKASHGLLTDNLAVSSFVASTAAQSGQSERKIFRLVAAGLALDDESIALLRLSPNRVTLSDLQTLGKCGDPVKRRAVCEVLSRGEAKNAKAALDAQREGLGKAAISPIDAETLKIKGAWARGSKAARRRFVEDYRTELEALLGSGGSDES